MCKQLQTVNLVTAGVTRRASHAIVSDFWWRIDKHLVTFYENQDFWNVRKITPEHQGGFLVNRGCP